MTSALPPVESARQSSEVALSPLQRLVAVYARPANAWGGLKERAQWWFPLLVTVIVSVASLLALYDRAMIPMITEQWDEQVAAGNMTSEQVDRMTAFMEGPTGKMVFLGQQVVMIPVLTLVAALLVWFGAGFVLGSGMKFRHAFEVAAWSGLVLVPAQLLTAALAWSRETMRGIHLGFGILLPENDPPTRLLTAAGAFLDALGPLSIWYLVVGILGATALSGAPRKSVAWVLTGIYLAFALFGAAMAAMFTPAA